MLLMRVDFVEEFDFLIKLLGIHGLLENLLMAKFTGRVFHVCTTFVRLKLLSFSMLSCRRNSRLHCELTICVVFVVNIDKNHFLEKQISS